MCDNSHTLQNPVFSVGVILLLLCESTQHRGFRRHYWQGLVNMQTKTPVPPKSKSKITHCIFCGAETTKNKCPEHILLNKLGGRETTTSLVCKKCNSDFGQSIDSNLAEQTLFLRNSLQLRSGSRQPPPPVKGLDWGEEKIDFDRNGVPRYRNKSPLIVEKKDDGGIRISITANNEKQLEDLKEAAVQEVRRMGYGNFDRKKLDDGLGEEYHTFTPLQGSPIPISFGGHSAIRSMTKACLLLWGHVVGDYEVQKNCYDATKSFILGADSTSDEVVLGLDSRQGWDEEKIEREFSLIANVIKICSDDHGSVFASFRLYGLITWSFVLAKKGGVSNKSAILLSNPLEPKVRKVGIGGGYNLDPTWLMAPIFDQSDINSQKKWSSVGEFINERSSERYIGETVYDVLGPLAERGISTGDPEFKKAMHEISSRLAHIWTGQEYKKRRD